MGDALLMRRRDGIHHWNHDGQHTAQRQAARGDDVRQRPSLHQLHRQE